MNIKQSTKRPKDSTDSMANLLCHTLFKTEKILHWFWFAYQFGETSTTSTVESG